jgi:hypothetical protein
MMPIPREVFEHADGAPFPELGQLIRVTLHDGEVFEGTVTLVWFGMCVVVDVMTASGKRYFIPELDDAWEPA